ncbi:MAG TPA: hypothetical protein VM369_09795 [Candidatus Binatia bacterium]|nr:hypothetical protein [Candidatus Binatia bacterium]
MTASHRSDTRFGRAVALAALVLCPVVLGLVVVFVVHPDALRRASTAGPPPAPLAVPPPSAERVLVQGWKKGELQKALADFAQLYATQLPADFATAIAAGRDGAWRVTLPVPVAAPLFCFLVNYLQYPKDLDPGKRHIVVGGILTAGGQDALVYVPEGARRYDLVHIRMGEGTFAMTFDDLEPRPAESVVPEALDRLLAREPAS